MFGWNGWTGRNKKHYQCRKEKPRKIKKSTQNSSQNYKNRQNNCSITHTKYITHMLLSKSNISENKRGMKKIYQNKIKRSFRGEVDSSSNRPFQHHRNINSRCLFWNITNTCSLSRSTGSKQWRVCNFLLGNHTTSSFWYK